MKKLLLLLVFCVYSTWSNSQIVPIGCQEETDAFVGLDRKNWNGGNTTFHSEGYMINFTLPSNTFGDCKKITDIEITVDVFGLDLSNLPPDCNVGDYWTNIYLGCASTAPASCPTSDLIQEFPSPTPLNITGLYSYNCVADGPFEFGDVLGFDIIPAVTTGCTNGQSMVSTGQIEIDFEVCVEVTIGDDVIDVPVNLGSDLNVCINGTENIDAGPGYDQYSWSPNGQMTQMISEGPGIYVVTVSDANGCTSSDEIELIPIPLSVSVTSSDTDNIVCDPDMVTLTAISTATTFAWSNGMGGSMITVGAGIYTVTATDANGCQVNSDADPITVIVNQPPSAGTNNSLSACNDNQTYNLFTLLGAADAAGSWIDVDGSAVNLADPTNVSFLNVTPGNYDFSYTVLGTPPCTDDVATITVTVEQTVNAGNDNSLDVCNDNQDYNLTNLLGTADSGGTWSDGGAGVNLSDPTNVDFENVPAGNYNFTYTVLGAAPCTDDVATINVTVAQMPNAGSDNTLMACNDGQFFDLETLLGIHDGGGFWTDVGGAGVNVNASPTAVSFFGLSAGVYSFSYTAVGTLPCINDIAIIEVTVFASPNAGVNNVTSVCNDGSTVDLDGLIGPHDLNGTWFDDDGALVNLSDPTNVDFVNVAPGVYDFTYLITGVAPCFDALSSVTVTVEESANAGDDNTVAVCEGGLYDLNTALSFGTPLTGNWSDDDGTFALVGSVFNTAGFEGQSLSFTYTLGSGFCGMDDATIQVDVVTSLSAGMDNMSNMFCYDPSDMIDLFSYIPGADTGGTFDDLDGSGALQNNFINASLLSNGTYQFQYSVGDGVVCPIETSIIEISFFANPTFTMQGGFSFCEEDCSDVSIQFTGTPIYVFSFDVYNENDVLTDLYLNNTMSSSLTITVCNDGGMGTVSGDTLHIGDSFDSWYLYPSAIGDLNCNVDLVGVSDSLFFDIADSYVENINPTLCMGESITVNNVVYDFDMPSGMEVISNPNDCDSTFIIDLMFYPEADSLIDLTLCEGDSIEVNGVFYSELNPVGSELIVGGSQNQCDSLIDINLSFTMEFESFPTAMICLGDSIFLENAWQTTAGVYTDNLISSQGCDSIVMTTLSIDPCLATFDILTMHNECFGDNEGEISVSADGGTLPFTVDWSGNGMNGSIELTQLNTAELITGLTSGTYNLVISDGTGMIVQMIPVTIIDNNPELILELDIMQEISCYLDTNGVINADVQGGSAPFSYSWNPTLSNAPMQSNLGPGTYALTVTDNFNCTVTGMQELVEPDEITFDFTTMDITCNSPNGGTLDVSNIAGGMMPYQVFVDGNIVDPTSTIENLQAGMHTFLVVDDNGCEQDSMFSIAADQSINYTIDVQNIPCDLSTFGIFEVTSISGGMAPYQVFVDGTLISPSLIAENLLVGQHSFLIIDASNCQVGANFMIEEDNQVNFDVIEVDIVCADGIGGTIEVANIEGVQMPIEIFLDGISVGTTQIITDVTAGFHTITVVDALGCSRATFAMIESNDPIEYDIDIVGLSCDGSSGGDLSVSNVSGGEGPYEVFVDGILLDAGLAVTGLTQGQHTVLVSDMNGCEKDSIVNIDQADGILFDLISTNSACSEANSGSILIENISGGNAPYTVSINGNAIPEPYLLENLSAGNYDVLISDDADCEISQQVEIQSEITPILLDYTLDYIIDEGDSILLEGILDVTVDSLEWMSSGSLSCLDCANPFASPLSSTQYQLSVWDLNGCTQSIVINIEVIEIPDFELYVSNAFSPNDDGVNDTFDLLSAPDSDIIIESHFIYDRWGNLVQSEAIEIGPDNGWDGRFENKFVVPGIYVYVIEYKNGLDGETQVLSGELSLMK